MGADDAVSGGSSPVAFLSFFLLLENSPIAYVCSRRVAIVLGFAVRRGSDPASCGCGGGPQGPPPRKGFSETAKGDNAKGKLARKNARSICLPSLGQR